MTRDEMIKWLGESTTADQWFKSDGFFLTDRPDGWKVVPNLNFDGLCVVKTKGHGDSDTIFFNDVFEQPVFIDGAKYRLNDMPFDFTYVKSTNRFIDASNPMGTYYSASEFGRLFIAVLVVTTDYDSLFNRVKFALGERDVDIAGEDHLVGQVKVDSRKAKILDKIIDEFKIPEGGHVINWLRNRTKQVKPVVDNIAIDCSTFHKNEKKYVQDLFFKLGYKWKDGRYHHLCADGYIGEKGKLSYYVNPINGEDEVHFNHLKFLNLNELKDLAECNKSENRNTTKPRSNYDREILPGIFVDVYDVLSAFKTESPAVDHAVKKLLAPGKRGHKDRVTDLKEAIQSIEREIDRINQWGDK